MLKEIKCFNIQSQVTKVTKSQNFSRKINLLSPTLHFECNASLFQFENIGVDKSR